MLDKFILDKSLSSTRTIQRELNDLQNDINQNVALKRIIQDWNVISDGDKIAVAKAYKLYGTVKRDCRTGSKFYISTALSDTVNIISGLEQNTMHPYVKFQKARILKLISDTKTLPDDFSGQIVQAYNDTIWTIKSNPLYSAIKETKSYASILWLYGIQLSSDESMEGLQKTIRYLEESSLAFSRLKDNSSEYYQCLLLLGETYLKLYLSNRATNLHYLRKARETSNRLLEDRDYYGGQIKSRATKFRNDLQNYGRF